MNLKVRFWLLGLALVSAVILSACGGGGGGGGGGSALNVNMLDTLKFDPATLSASGGSATVNVKNGGAQQHNFVVVKAGDESRVATEAAAKNGDATGIAGVLAGGAPVAAGASETVTVTAPAGSYVYLCTIPGHFQAGMQGTLTIQ